MQTTIEKLTQIVGRDGEDEASRRIEIHRSVGTLTSHVIVEPFTVKKNLVIVKLKSLKLFSQYKKRRPDIDLH